MVLRALIVIVSFVLSATCFAETSPVPPVIGPHGERLLRLATYTPKPCVPKEARAKRLKGSGVFILRIRPNGTVSTVDTVRSTGYRLLDDASIRAFSRWRFIPGAATKVKVPVQYTGEYPADSPDC
jgi:TonB family protein